MSASIRFVALEKGNEFGPDGVLTEFTVGDSCETHLIPLDCWTLDEYVAQWEEALPRILEDSQPTAMVTSIHHARNVEYVVALFFYPLGGSRVVFQSEAVDRIDFVEGHATIHYNAVPPRRSLDDNGDPVCEWFVTLDDLRGLKNAVLELRAKKPLKLPDA